ncbi:MAG: helix-turn-helix domain-containing protein [Christensenellales bacterium]|jgi:transcriptional regulator with XRE-family HTH domain
MKNDIGLKIKKMRQIKNISQSQLAKKAGIAQSTLSFIENGKKNPQFDTLSAICKGLETSILEILIYEEKDRNIKIFEQHEQGQNIIKVNRINQNVPEF